MGLVCEPTPASKTNNGFCKVQYGDPCTIEKAGADHCGTGLVCQNDQTKTAVCHRKVGEQCNSDALGDDDLCMIGSECTSEGAAKKCKVSNGEVCWITGQVTEDPCVDTAQCETVTDDKKKCLLKTN